LESAVQIKAFEMLFSAVEKGHQFLSLHKI